MSSDSNEIRATFAIDVDQASINKSKTAVNQMQNDLRKLVNDGGKPRDSSNRNAEKSAFEAADKYNSTIREQAGLLGDVDTALSALGGTAAGELFAVAEGAAQLVSSAKGLPASLQALWQSLGMAGIVVAAASITIFKLSEGLRNAEKAAEDYTNQLLKQRKEMIAFGDTATTDDIEDLIRQKEREIEINQQLIDETQRGIDASNDYIDSLNPAAQGLFALGDGLGLMGGELDAAKGTVKDATEENKLLSEELEQLIKLREDERVIINDTVDALLDEAKSTGDKIRIEEEARNATAEANQERLRQIDIERRALEAELATLQASDVQNEKSRERIEDLQKEIAALGDEADIVSEYATGAADATQDLADAAKEAEQAAEKTAQAYQKNAESIAKADSDLRRKNLDIQKDAARDEIDARRDARNDLNDLRFDAYRDEQDAYKDHQRTLRDIQKQAQRDREDLAFNLDFLGLFDLEKSVREQNEDAAQAAEDAAEDRRVENDRSLTDLKIALKREADERKIAANRQREDAQTAYKRQIEDANTALKNELDIAQKGYDAKLRLEQSYFERSLTLQRSGSQGGLLGGAPVSQTVNNNTATINNNISANGRELQRLNRNVSDSSLGALIAVFGGR